MELELLMVGARPSGGSVVRIELNPFIVLAVWIPLLAATGLLLWRGSPETKRVWFPRGTVLAAATFLGFGFMIIGNQPLMYIMTIGVVGMTFVNIKSTRFCANCGAHNLRKATCTRCGDDLD